MTRRAISPDFCTPHARPIDDLPVVEGRATFYATREGGEPIAPDVDGNVWAPEETKGLLWADLSAADHGAVTE